MQGNLCKLAAELAPYSRICGRMATEAYLYGKVRKIQELRAKCLENERIAIDKGSLENLFLGNFWVGPAECAVALNLW